MARPTEYDALTVLKAIEEYLDECKQQLFLPQIAGLAVKLGVARSTIYEWKAQHPEFSDTLELLLALQEAQLVQNSLTGNYNSTIAKMLLNANHNVIEKHQTDVTSNGETIVFIPSEIAGKNNITTHEADASTG